MTHKHHNDKKQDNDWEEVPADIPAEEAAEETGAPMRNARQKPANSKSFAANWPRRRRN